MRLSLAFFFFYISHRLYLSHYVPHIWPDEVLFFNPSYELFTTGILRTTVLEGLIPGMESYTLWMPPLYMLVLCGWFHTGWIGIDSARFVSALLGAGSVLILQIFLVPDLYKKKQSFSGH